MRTGAGFISSSSALTGGATPLMQSPAAAPPAMQHSPWHSPVPYLFGGLAAMLGLIAFALLILACSYWRLSGYLDGADADADSDDRNGNGKPVDAAVKSPPCFGEGFVVIMAGDQKPTYLATPISSTASKSVGFGGKVTANDDEKVVVEIENGRETAGGAVTQHGGDQNHEVE